MFTHHNPGATQRKAVRSVPLWHRVYGREEYRLQAIEGHSLTMAHLQSMLRSTGVVRETASTLRLRKELGGSILKLKKKYRADVVMLVADSRDLARQQVWGRR